MTNDSTSQDRAAQCRCCGVRFTKAHDIAPILRELYGATPDGSLLDMCDACATARSGTANRATPAFFYGTNDYPDPGAYRGLAAKLAADLRNAFTDIGPVRLGTCSHAGCGATCEPDKRICNAHATGKGHALCDGCPPAVHEAMARHRAYRLLDAMDSLAEAFGEIVRSREMRRRAIDHVLAEDARRFPAFATARRCAVMACAEPPGPSIMTPARATALTDGLRAYEDARGGLAAPADGSVAACMRVVEQEPGAILHTQVALHAYERARAL